MAKEINVAIISEETANTIAGVEYNEGNHYGPILYNDKWIISLIEAQYLGDPALILEVIKFIPPLNEEE